MGQLPAKQNLWIFVLAGQSNMAGRGLVEPQDTIPDGRILTLNKNDQIVVAKEPLHYYEPTRTGLDCGLSFARKLIKSLPADVSILLVPLAVGGSSIQQWLADSVYREVKLLSNAKHKIAIAKKAGTMKGILWHQGETNAMRNDIEQYSAHLKTLARVFREIGDEPTLPFMVAELGSFSTYPEAFKNLNVQLANYTETDKFSGLINTGDLQHKGDSLHFDSPSQRLMGERFAQAYVSKFLTAQKPKR